MELDLRLRLGAQKKSAVDFSAAVQFGALFVEFVVVAAEAQGFANVPPLGRGLIATAISAGARRDPTV